MATKQYNSRIQWKKDTASNWTSNNPVLLNGEIAIVVTNANETRFKIGDGTSSFTALPYQDEAVRALITAVQDEVDTKCHYAEQHPLDIMAEVSSGAGVVGYLHAVYLAVLVDPLDLMQFCPAGEVTKGDDTKDLHYGADQVGEEQSEDGAGEFGFALLAVRRHIAFHVGVGRPPLLHVEGHGEYGVQTKGDEG